MQQMTHLQKLYLEGEIATSEEYTALQIDLEKKTLDEKLAVIGLEAHEREKLQVKMLEAQIKFNEECKRQDEKQQKNVRRHQTKYPKSAFLYARNSYALNWKKLQPTIIGILLPKRILLKK